MNELIKTLEEIQVRTSGIADEMELSDVVTANMVDDALAQAREFATKVDLLHETIRDNVEHSIAAWLEARIWELSEAADYAQEHDKPDVAQSHQDRAHHYRDVVRGIKSGAWRA